MPVISTSCFDNCRRPPSCTVFLSLLICTFLFLLIFCSFYMPTPHHSSSFLPSVLLSHSLCQSRCLLRKISEEAGKMLLFFFSTLCSVFTFLLVFLLLPRASVCLLLNPPFRLIFFPLSSSWMLNRDTRLRWRSHWATGEEEKKKTGLMSDGGGCLCVCVCVHMYVHVRFARLI